MATSGLDDGLENELVEEIKEIKTLYLESEEGDIFELDRQIAMQSALIKTMWQGEKHDQNIPLPNVKVSPQLLFVIKHLFGCVIRALLVVLFVFGSLLSLRRPSSTCINTTTTALEPSRNHSSPATCGPSKPPLHRVFWD